MADRINLLSGDFESIRSEIYNKLKGLPGWRDTVESGVGTTLIRLYSSIGDMMLYRINILANENYAATVQIKENMLKIIKLLNYKVKRAVPSHGEVLAYIREANPSNIVIPQGTRLTTTNGILFYTVYENELLAGDKEITLKIVQGIKKEETYKSAGTENQTFILNSDNTDYYIGGKIWPNSQYEYSGIQIYIDDELWAEVNSLVDAEASDNVYMVEQYSDYAVKITFGDNSFGKIPPTNAVIKFVYNLNIGKYGNVNNGAITSISDTISDINTNPISMFVTQSSSFLNGGDPEDLESIRANAPIYFKAGDRAITREDIVALINANFSNILDVYILAEEDSQPPNFKEFNQITIGLLLKDTDGLPLVPDTNGENYLSFYENVNELIKVKKSLTVWPKYIIPVPIQLEFKIKYKKYEGYTDSSVRVGIQSKIEEYLLNYGRLGALIKSSDIIYAIESLAGIDYCYFEMKRTTDASYGITNIQCTSTEFPIQAIGNYLTMVRE